MFTDSTSDEHETLPRQSDQNSYTNDWNRSLARNSRKSRDVLVRRNYTNYGNYIPRRILTRNSKEILFEEPRRRRLILDTPFSVRSTVSYGLNVFAKDTERWAIIQRKHSVEFLLFIRGSYRLTHLPLLLSCITKIEASCVEKCLRGGPHVFTEVYIEELGLCPEGLEYALIRMAESRNVTLNLLSKFDLSSNELSWTWPKGRLSYSQTPDFCDREVPFDCAKREFTEEVELDLPPPLFVSDTYISTQIRTITGRTIESRYWIYIIPNEIPMTPPKCHPEVANRLWVDTATYQIMIPHDTLFQQIVDIVSKI